MKKRYDLKHPHHDKYNEFYVKFQHESEILNAGRETHPSLQMIIFDKKNIETQVLIREGNNERQYYKLNKPCDCHLKIYEDQLREVEYRFKSYQKSRVQQGYEQPKEWPPDLLVEKLRLEAKLDVCQGEVEILKRKLAELDSVVKKKEDSDVLAYGLICRGTFHGLNAPNDALIRVLKEIDGQLISQLDDGTLYINDPRSPYDGMLVSDYRRLAREWVLEKIHADRAKLEQLQETAQKNGLVVPNQLPFQSRCRVSRNSLPKWPEWAKNVKARTRSNVEH